MRLGLIGVGTMGSRMALRLMGSGYEVAVHDMRPAAVAEVVQHGASVCYSPWEIAESAEIIILMLPDSKSVENVVLGSKGVIEAIKKDAVVVDMSSSSPMSTIAICDLLKQKEAHFLDAPVSGGRVGAHDGTLTIMVGGERVIYERVKPIFSVLGKRIFYVGKIGSGHAIKAINNMLSATSMWAACEGLLVAKKAGVPIDVALEVINSSSGRSFSTENKFPKYIVNSNYNLGFTIGLTYKDIATATELAESLGVPLLVGKAIQEIFGTARNVLGDDEDQTCIIKLLETWAKTTLVEKKEQE